MYVPACVPATVWHTMSRPCEPAAPRPCKPAEAAHNLVLINAVCVLLVYRNAQSWTDSRAVVVMERCVCRTVCDDVTCIEGCKEELSNHKH